MNIFFDLEKCQPVRLSKNFSVLSQVRFLNVVKLVSPYYLISLCLHNNRMNEERSVAVMMQFSGKNNTHPKENRNKYHSDFDMIRNILI